MGGRQDKREQEIRHSKPESGVHARTHTHTPTFYYWIVLFYYIFLLNSLLLLNNNKKPKQLPYKIATYMLYVDIMEQMY